MRRRLRCGWLSVMRIAAALTVAAALAVAAPARADAPPVEAGVHCHQTLQPRYRLAKVKRRGLPVEITCDGPAKFFAMPDFVAMTPQSRDLSDASPNSIPAIAGVKETSMSEAGTVTVRPRFTKLALKIMRRYPKTKLLVGMATMREDGHYWSDPADWSRTVVVR
jgi:hypothetical protein